MVSNNRKSRQNSISATFQFPWPRIRDLSTSAMGVVTYMAKLLLLASFEYGPQIDSSNNNNKDALCVCRAESINREKIPIGGTLSSLSVRTTPKSPCSAKRQGDESTSLAGLGSPVISSVGEGFPNLYAPSQHPRAVIRVHAPPALPSLHRRCRSILSCLSLHVISHVIHCIDHLSESKKNRS